MAKASIQPIYDRMNSVENYHPFTADTYADWSLEAGDIVTVSRDGKSLTGPVHNATVRWTGKQKVSLESRGEKERGSIAKMSARAFNSGGNGGGAYRSGYGGRKLTDKQLSGISKTLNDVTIWATEENGKLRAEIKVQADRIDAVVTEDGKIKAGVIVDAINNGTVSIVASKVKISDSDTLESIMTVSSLGVNFKKSVNISGSNGIAVGAGGYISLGAYSIRLETLQGMVRSFSLSPDGTVLTLTPFYGTPVNFNKATKLSGKWGSGTYTVTAKQGNTVVNTNTTKVTQLQKPGSIDVIGNSVGQEISVYATENGGTNAVFTGFKQWIYIDADEVYQKGKRDGAGSYTLFGYFDKYGTVSVEGQTYTAYITQDTSASANHLALYKK